MVIFYNGLIKLDYDPAKDILFVDMPTVDSVIMPEVERALGIIVEHVRNYDVKRLLIDARRTEVLVSEETYTSMLSEFISNLMKTRLQKLARIVSSSKVRENVVKKVVGEQFISLEFHSFTDIEPAIEWLMQKQYA